MRPACRFAQAGRSVRIWTIELGIPFIAIRLQDAACVGQMAMDVFFLPIRGEGVDSAGGHGTRPRPLIPDIGPDPALLHALTKAAIAQGFVQNPDRGVIGMQQITGHDIRLDPLNQRGQHLHRAPAPVDQCAVGNVSPHAREDFVQAIQRNMIVEFRNQNVGQQRSTRHAAGDGPAGCRVLHHLFATTAGLFQPRDLQDLELCRDQVQHFADILTHKTQIATAIRAAGPGVKLATLARRGIGHTRSTAGFAFSGIVVG